MSSLFEAIESGNLENVKLELTTDRKELDTEDYWKLRPIDVAAGAKKIKILDYLIEQGASLKNRSEKPSLLYWLINEIEDKSKPKIVTWIRNNQEKLLATDSSLTREHLKAILGKNADWDSFSVHGGLLPIHYGALMDNPHCIDLITKWADQPLPQNTWFASYSFPLLLATNKKFKLLNQLNRNNFFIDLNIASQNHYDQEYEETLASRLAGFEEWHLLKELAEKNSIIDLNAKIRPFNTASHKKTLAWFLVIKSQWNLLKELAPKSPEIDLDVGYPRLTVAYYLADQKRWDLLGALSPYSPNINLNAGEKTENTLAYLLIIDQQWKLIKEVMRKSPLINLQANGEVFKDDGAVEKKCLLELLLHFEQWELTETIIEAHLINFEKIQEANKFLNCLKEQVPNPTLNHLITYLQLKAVARLITHQVENYKDVVEEEEFSIEDLLYQYEHLFKQIPVESIYYKKANYSKKYQLDNIISIMSKNNLEICCSKNAQENITNKFEGKNLEEKDPVNVNFGSSFFSIRGSSVKKDKMLKNNSGTLSLNHS